MIHLLRLSREWKTVELGEICAVQGGFPAPQDESAFENGEIPFVRMKDVGRDHFTNDLHKTEQALNRGHFDSGKYRITPPGSILMPRSGSVGLNHRALLTIDAVIVSHLCAVVPITTGIDSGFLYRILCLMDMRRLTKKTTGLDSVAFEDLKRIAVPIPPLDQQRRIADVLDRVDLLRARRRASMEQSEMLRQTIFLDMFGDPSDSMSALPRVALGSIVKRVTYGFTSPMRHLDTGIPIVTAKNVRYGSIDFANTHYASVDEFAALTAKSKPERGDILVTKDGTIGRYAIVDTDSPICINQSVALIKTQPDVALPSYLAGCLGTVSIQRHLVGMRKGHALSHLQITELSAMTVPLPPLAQQLEHQKRVDAVARSLQEQRNSSEEIEDLAKSLQHQVLAGLL